MNRIRTLLSLAAITLAFASLATADPVTVTVGALKDNTIYRQNADNSLGVGVGMFAGTNGAGAVGNHRALVAFDLSTLPEGAIVTDVRMRLTLGQVAGSGGAGTGGDATTREITIQRMLSDWGEGTAGEGTTQIGGTGQLFPAGEGDATWNNAFHGQTPWTSPINTPGGYFADTISSSTLVDRPLTSTVSNNHAYYWNATSTMIADVQGWLNDPTTNFGWILRNTDEEGLTNFRAFWTRDAQDLIQGPSNLGRHPALEITYTLVPEPSSWLLAGLAAVCVGALRLRRGRTA